MKSIALSVCTLMMSLSMLAQKPVKDSLELKTAHNHPMQYFVSLPEKWSRDKKWPIVVIIESADKEYRENALRFVRARKDMPFILVAPYNVNNSRSGRRDPKVFPYSTATWDIIDRTGDCQFNMEGISSIIKDVQQDYNGEKQFYLTGFEAGAHTVWQFVFQHPEMLLAAAPVEGNYNQNSCMSEPLFSKDPARINLPVRGFAGSLDTIYGPSGVVYGQWKNALKAGMDHGYKNIAETIVQGKGHVPMPAEVLKWFYDSWNKK